MCGLTGPFPSHTSHTRVVCGLAGPFPSHTSVCGLTGPFPSHTRVVVRNIMDFPPVCVHVVHPGECFFAVGAAVRGVGVRALVLAASGRVFKMFRA